MAISFTAHHVSRNVVVTKNDTNQGFIFDHDQI